MNRPALALLLSAFLPLGAGAVELGAAGELGGSYRNLFESGRDPSGTTIRTDFSRLRLAWQGGAGAWSWRLLYDHLVTVGGVVQSPDFDAIRALPDPTYLDGDAGIAEGGRYEWRHRVYRATVGYDWDRGKLALGRQRIAWGSGRLWNPTDRFNPVQPTALEPEEKTGVDAAVGELRFGAFGALQGVAAPGAESRNVSSKLAVRWRDTVAQVDYAGLVGRIGSENVVGLDFSGNLWGGAVRFEGLVGRPGSRDRYGQTAVGYDYTLAGKIFPAGLYLLAEYFYNGAARGAAPAPVPSDRLESRNRHFLGFSAGYDLTPLWRIDGLTIWDVTGGSLFVSPRLTWSAAANIEVSAFAQLFTGGRRSEFGTAHDAYLLRLEWFF